MGRKFGGDLDAVFTPDALALACATLIAEGFSPQVVLEPAAGDGAFIRSSRHVWPGVRTVAVDLNPDARGLADADEAYVGDFRDLSPRTDPAVTVALTNFAFSTATEQIPKAFQWAGAVVSLLPADVVTRRPWAEFWQTHGAIAYRVDERPWECCREVGLFVFAPHFQPGIVVWQLARPIYWTGLNTQPARTRVDRGFVSRRTATRARRVACPFSLDSDS